MRPALRSAAAGPPCRRVAIALMANPPRSAADGAAASRSRTAFGFARGRGLIGGIHTCAGNNTPATLLNVGPAASRRGSHISDEQK
jgi:hypothetical protein